MKILKDQLKIVMPDFHAVQSFLIKDHNGLLYVLQPIDLERMSAYQAKAPQIPGRPDFYSVLDRTITIYPRPDKEYEATIEYLPPKRVL